MWLCVFGCNFGKKMEKINLLKQQEQLDSRHANTTATQIYEMAAHIKFKLYMHRKYHKRNINSFLVSCQPAGRRLKVSCQPATGILIRKWHFYGIMTLSYNLLF